MALRCFGAFSVIRFCVDEFAGSRIDVEASVDLWVEAGTERKSYSVWADYGAVAVRAVEAYFFGYSHCITRLGLLELQWHSGLIPKQA